MTNELDELVLKNFLYGTNPLQNYVELVDARNHEKEDNLKSEKQLSKIEIVKALLERLGWANARDEDAIAKADLKQRFANNVVDDPLFKRQKRLNELFNLNKSYNIHKEMTPQQVLMWCNSLLKDFSLQIRAGKETYYLEFQNDLFALIKRKNNIGKIYFDRDNLLKQVALNQQDDLFIDDEPPQPEVVVPVEPQPQEETPEPPIPEPEVPEEPKKQEEETPPPQSTTTPAQRVSLRSQGNGMTGRISTTRVVARVSRAHAMEAEDGSLRHVVTRLVSTRPIYRRAGSVSSAQNADRD